MSFYVTRMYSHAIRISSACHSYVILMPLVCHLHVLVRHLYHLYVTRMSFVCHSYVLVCYVYVTRMYSYVVLPWINSIIITIFRSFLILDLVNIVFLRGLVINWWIFARTILVVTGARVFKTSMKILSNNGYNMSIEF